MFYKQININLIKKLNINKYINIDINIDINKYINLIKKLNININLNINLNYCINININLIKNININININLIKNININININYSSVISLPILIFTSFPSFRTPRLLKTSISVPSKYSKLSSLLASAIVISELFVALVKYSIICS